MAAAARVALIILDGFGLSAYEKGNAVLSAKLPFLASLLQQYPAVGLAASGAEVGLEWGEVGNSEVGHFNIGAGRVVLQDLPRITAAIQTGRFFQNAALVNAARQAKATKARFHILGIASGGGIHGHIDHMKAMIRFAKQQGLTDVVVHAITDGRDTQPKVAERFVQELMDTFATEQVGQIGTLVGRYFAMDRDKRWDRIQRAFDAFVDGKGTPFQNPLEGLKQAYGAGQSDETLEPMVNPAVPRIADGDVVVCTNYRADRARQLMQVFTDPSFTGFQRSHQFNALSFVSFTNYGQEATGRVKVAFFAEPMPNYLAYELSQAKRYQLHVAETEKYAHVTYFLNAGQESPLPGEERVLIPSPKVASYDLEPAMSAERVAKEFLQRFRAPYSFGVVNFANPDMVGHTGNAAATVQAIEQLDNILERVVTQLTTDGVSVVISADHGNCEQMIHPTTGDIDKEHTVNPVPCLIIRPGHEQASTVTFRSLGEQQPVGVLADIAPTVLELLELPAPADMTGQSLVNVV